MRIFWVRVHSHAEDAALIHAARKMPVERHVEIVPGTLCQRPGYVGVGVAVGQSGLGAGGFLSTYGIEFELQCAASRAQACKPDRTSNLGPCGNPASVIGRMRQSTSCFQPALPGSTGTDSVRRPIRGPGLKNWAHYL